MPLIIREELPNGKLWGLWKIQEDIPTLYDQLSPGEVDLHKFHKITHPDKQKEFLASRNAIKMLLESSGHVYPGTTSDPWGRAFLAGSPFHISLSHSHGYAAAILCPNGKTGIDIEFIQEKVLRIRGKYLKPEEMTDDFETATLYWCVKEVMYKIYSARQLSLKDEIHLINTEKGEQHGLITAKMDPEPDKIFHLHYRIVDDHAIVFPV